MIDRRALLAGGMAATLPLPARAAAPAHPAPDDEAFWATVAAEYDLPQDVIQLENGNWGAMSRPVRAAYEQAVARVNRDTSYYARRGMLADLGAARAAVAAELGVPADEIAFTRNATEALKALILGYNRLTVGDAIVYADLDYDSMQACMESLGPRRGVRVRRIALPEPATRASLIDAYAQVMADEPRLKLILLTHLSHRTGLVIPVREITAMARARGIDVIVDAAHSWQQLDFALPDLDCDFVGLNGHKWLGAPLGIGILHIRQSALSRIDRDPRRRRERPRHRHGPDPHRHARLCVLAHRSRRTRLSASDRPCRPRRSAARASRPLGPAGAGDPRHRHTDAGRPHIARRDHVVPVQRGNQPAGECRPCPATA
jgi:isopenicillin-N epimerase